MSAPAAPVAVYERRVAASLERVWENVHDWEHLPFLHSGSFCDIALEEQAAWGWRARIALPPAQAPSWILLELRRETEDRYHSRTLEGPGAGTDIVTTLSALGARETGVRVEFLVPEVAEADREAVGRAFVALYTRLWDEDEAMMVVRQAFLDAGAGSHSGEAGPSGVVRLGPESELAEGVLEAGGRSYRLLRDEAGWVAHEAVCPHMGGPLDAALVHEGAVVCPWHGYRFDLRSGRGPKAQHCRLRPARVEVDPASGQASLHFAG